MTPLGGPSIDAAWRAQYLRRLAGPVFTPLGGPSIDAAWRAQYLCRLAGPVTTTFGGIWRKRIDEWNRCLQAASLQDCLSIVVSPILFPPGME